MADIGALLDNSAPRCLDPPVLDLAVDATALRTLRRPRRLTPARYRRRAIDQLLQPRQCIRKIPIKAAIPLLLDDDHALGCNPLIINRAKSQLDRLRQRRCANIEAQMHRRRDLVDVLAARTLGAYGGPFDLCRVDRGHWIASALWY